MRTVRGEWGEEKRREQKRTKHVVFLRT